MVPPVSPWGRDFFLGEEFCYIMGLASENRAILQSHFQVALDSILGCLSRGDLPDYTTIKSDLIMHWFYLNCNA
jgi:hypothetical protein